MEMKDRVDNFLKVARTKLLDKDVDRYERSNLNDLMGSLLNLISDPAEKDRLDEEYNNILREADLALWDERFLNTIAGEREESDEEKLSRLTHQVSQGRSKQRMGQTLAVPHGTGTTNVTLAGAGTGATWSNQASIQEELQQLKDEIRAKRGTI